jgi:hypothetical protein
VTGDPVAAYLSRPLTPVDPAVLTALEAGPIAAHDALPLADVDRLRDPAPLSVETGWTTLPDGVGYIAVRTAMPGVTGEMVDWWFDWHPRDPVRYRIWHPLAHTGNAFDPPAPPPAAKAHWGAVHHPVEDVGLGTVHARIAFRPPHELGMADDALDDPRVATIVCGVAGDDRRHAQHTPMFHVFLEDPEGGGVVLRSRFWLGADLRPYGPLGGVGGWAMNRPAVRRRLISRAVPPALATHCAEEYAHLGALLPELYGRFGPGGTD